MAKGEVKDRTGKGGGGRTPRQRESAASGAVVATSDAQAGGSAATVSGQQEPSRQADTDREEAAYQNAIAAEKNAKKNVDKYGRTKEQRAWQKKQHAKRVEKWEAEQRKKKKKKPGVVRRALRRSLASGRRGSGGGVVRGGNIRAGGSGGSVSGGGSSRGSGNGGGSSATVGRDSGSLGGSADRRDSAQASDQQQRSRAATEDQNEREENSEQDERKEAQAQRSSKAVSERAGTTANPGGRARVLDRTEYGEQEVTRVGLNDQYYLTVHGSKDGEYTVHERGIDTPKEAEDSEPLATGENRETAILAAKAQVNNSRALDKRGAPIYSEAGREKMEEESDGYDTHERDGDDGE